MRFQTEFKILWDFLFSAYLHVRYGSHLWVKLRNFYIIFYDLKNFDIYAFIPGISSPEEVFIVYYGHAMITPYETYKIHLKNAFLNESSILKINLGNRCYQMKKFFYGSITNILLMIFIFWIMCISLILKKISWFRYPPPKKRPFLGGSRS